MSEVETVETPVAEAEPKHEFNKELQQVQQEKANEARRADNLDSRNTEMQTDLDNLRAELASRPEPAAAEEPDRYEMVGNHEKEIAELRQQLQSQATQLNTQKEKDQWDTSLKAFDKEHGKECRTGALNRAKKAFTEAGYTFKGSDFPSMDQTLNQVEKAYIIEHYENKGKPKVERPKTDTGIGGSNFVDLGDDIPTGSMEDVVAAMKARGR